MSNYPSNEYNPDGSMTPEYREELRNDGWSEDKINNLEQIRMRHARVDQEQAEWEKQWKKEVEEGRKKRKAEREARRKLGIEPTWKITYSSPDRIDPRKMNPAQRRRYEMSGLTTEELLSQGYIDLDDLKHKDWDDDDNPDDYYVNPNPPPEIPF